MVWLFFSKFGETQIEKDALYFVPSTSLLLPGRNMLFKKTNIYSNNLQTEWENKTITKLLHVVLL